MLWRSLSWWLLLLLLLSGCVYYKQFPTESKFVWADLQQGQIIWQEVTAAVASKGKDKLMEDMRWQFGGKKSLPLDKTAGCFCLHALEASRTWCDLRVWPRFGVHEGAYSQYASNSIQLPLKKTTWIYFCVFTGRLILVAQACTMAASKEERKKRGSSRSKGHGLQKANFTFQKEELWYISHSCCLLNGFSLEDRKLSIKHRRIGLLGVLLGDKKEN